jgi:hypothetical protein
MLQYPVIYLDELKKSMKKLSQKRWFTGWSSITWVVAVPPGFVDELHAMEC